MAPAAFRRRLALHEWMQEQDLADAQVDLRVQQLLERLHQDKLIVAFVAEFSRGKSELINAIFFADFGQRLLPSSAGRTTMCPTELLYDGSRPPSIRLLPIETRLKDATVAEFKNYADEWVTFALDLASAEKMGEALSRVSQVKRVPVELARKYGLYGDGEDDILAALEHGDEGNVDIPCWRHAVINFPHPLLQQGLVILDTPGLNAIGTEPELTLNLLPNAHALLFILAADAGVTKTDLEVWNQHLAGDDPATKAGRIVILNKIDGLWDELKMRRRDRRRDRPPGANSAQMLGIPLSQVFATSAQKALVAKVNGDDALLARSRLPALEASLSQKLIPAKRDIVGAASQGEVRSLAAERRRDPRRSRRGHRRAARRTAGASRQESGRRRPHDGARAAGEGAVRARARALHRVSQRVLAADQRPVRPHRTGGAAHERGPHAPADRGQSFHARRARRDGRLLPRHPRRLRCRGAAGVEIHDMMRAMYARFAKEHGLEPFNPPPFSVLKYQKEIERLERAYNTHFNTLWNMVSKAKFALMKRFFETIASRVRHVYVIANRDVEAWLKAVMSPLESQVREHHLQLRRRLDSIKRIHQASDELEERIGELEQQAEAIRLQRKGLHTRVASIDTIVETPDALPLAANA